MKNHYIWKAILHLWMLHKPIYFGYVHFIGSLCVTEWYKEKHHVLSVDLTHLKEICEHLDSVFVEMLLTCNHTLKVPPRKTRSRVALALIIPSLGKAKNFCLHSCHFLPIYFWHGLGSLCGCWGLYEAGTGWDPASQMWTWNVTETAVRNFMGWWLHLTHGCRHPLQKLNPPVVPQSLPPLVN